MDANRGDEPLQNDQLYMLVADHQIYCPLVSMAEASDSVD